MYNPADFYSKPEVDLIAKELKFSTYEIDYGDIRGSLKVWSIPIKSFLIDENSMPPNLAILWNHTSNFLNKGKKEAPNPEPIPPDAIQRPSEFNLMGTDSVPDQYEPYSEFTFKVGSNFFLLKAKTVLARLEPSGLINAFGDPVLLLNITVSIAVSKSTPTVDR